MTLRACRHRRAGTAAALILLSLLLSACEQPDMANQPRLDTYQSDSGFADGMAARPIPEGTVHRDQALNERPTHNPAPINRGTLHRGRQQFEIFCAPCHGRNGSGQGVIVQRGFPAPPSYHLPRLRQASDAHFYDVITHGYGVMYPYASRIRPADRWAIVTYIRALQLSRNARIDDVPEALRPRLREAPP
ncbi:c-type cytochrome [Alloalcanivorax mobilis]|uniref:c-type cytochrome n=1 Tax=Alloalcanivorax mobilis TaxID=2019569 RepID=UPI000C78D2D1|nr:cytochrome c [Alloalcanivorax mobilis]